MLDHFEFMDRTPQVVSGMHKAEARIHQHRFSLGYTAGYSDTGQVGGDIEFREVESGTWRLV